MGGFEREGTERFPMGGWVEPAPQPARGQAATPTHSASAYDALEHEAISRLDANFDSPASPAATAVRVAPAGATTGIDLASGEVLAFGEHFFLDEAALNDINALLLGCLARIYEQRLEAIAATLQLPAAEGPEVQSPSELSDAAMPEASGEGAASDAEGPGAPAPAGRLLHRVRQEVGEAKVPEVQGSPPAAAPDAPAA